MSSRPILISIIALLSMIGGLFMIFGGAAMAFANEQWLIDAGITDALGTVHMLGYVTLVLGLAMLIVGFLLWTGKTIAWYLAVIIFIANVAMSIYNVITGAPITSAVIPIVVAAIVLFYLFTPKVKAFYSVG
jgi:hypothetical protein